MSEELSFPRLWRFASKFRDRLTAAACADTAPLPRVRWIELQRSFSRLQVAQARKWKIAQDTLRSEAAGLMWSLLKHLEECQQSLAPSEPAIIATVAEVVADIRALSDEFSDVRLDLKVRKVSVVTDEIELEGVYLGRFRIQLELSELGSS